MPSRICDEGVCPLQAYSRIDDAPDKRCAPEETAMMMVAATQCSLLLAVFAAVPLGIIVAIFGLERAAERHRPRRP